MVPATLPLCHPHLLVYVYLRAVHRAKFGQIRLGTRECTYVAEVPPASLFHSLPWLSLCFPRAPLLLLQPPFS